VKDFVEFEVFFSKSRRPFQMLFYSRYLGAQLMKQRFPITIGGSASLRPPSWTVYIGQSVKKILETEFKNVEFIDRIVKENNSIYFDEKKVTVVSVQTETSRHNCPSRPDMVTRSLAPVVEKLKGNMDMNLCVKNKADVLPTVLAAYRACPFVSYKTAENIGEKGINIRVSIESGETISDEELEYMSILGESIRTAQGLVDMPPNDLNPDTFTEIVSELISELPNVNMEIIEDCEPRGMMGLHAVGKSSPHKPRMIVLTLNGSAPGEGVAIVGKTLCYDSGGYSLKGSQHQLGMKRDMGGGAASLGAFIALAKSNTTLTPQVPIHCILCVAENMIGPAAYRNDDIIKLYSGKTVEINNTDAEGRLVLADGLAYAHKDLNARTIIDIATLTGAASVASGKNHSSIFSPSSELATKAIASGKATGDLVHDLVFCPELHRANIKSAIADMKNAGTKPGDAPSSLAATFLYDHLVGAGFKSDKWLHVDMASVVDSGERGTGYGVALLANLVKSL